MIIRKVTIDDLETLIHLRFDYLAEDMDAISGKDKQLIEAQLRSYFPNHLVNQTFIGVVAEEDAKVMCAAFLTISERPANPLFINGKTGTLLNVLTYPQYRRQGLATKVIGRIIDEAKQCGVSSIDLFATDDGKVLYKRLGFCDTRHPAMRLKLQ